jgi:hypothetical protein
MNNEYCLSLNFHALRTCVKKCQVLLPMQPHAYQSHPPLSYNEVRTLSQLPSAPLLLWTLDRLAEEIDPFRIDV